MAQTISRQEYMNMFNVIGAAMKVHNVLGKGLAEAVYQEALGIQFERDGIAAEAQRQIPCWYGNVRMKTYFMVDYYYDGIMIELKSVEQVLAEHRSQLFNYMRLTHTCKGLLINFGEVSLHAERYIYQPDVDDFALLFQSNLKLYVDSEADKD